MTYVGETAGNSLNENLENLMDIDIEAAKQVSLNFDSSDHQGEPSFQSLLWKLAIDDQIIGRKIENQLIHSLGVLHPAEINI